MPIITNDNNIKQPEDKNCKLWRYMDLAKFMSLITNSQLYFSSSNNFSDIYEGHLSKKLLQDILSDQTDNFFNDSVEAMRFFCNNLKKSTYINCWHKNEHESAAMWELYSKTPESIAIETTYNKLINSIIIDSNINIYISEVLYLDYSKEKNSFDSTISPFIFKRKSFEHEKEIRLILQTTYMKKEYINILNNYNSSGKYIDINLNLLIKKIHLSPTSPFWFEKLIKDILKKYNLNIPVKKSTLNDISLY